MPLVTGLQILQKSWNRALRPAGVLFRRRIGALLRAKAFRVHAHPRIRWARLVDLATTVGVRPSMHTDALQACGKHTLAGLCAIAADPDPAIANPTLRLFLAALYPTASSGTSSSISNPRSTSRS